MKFFRDPLNLIFLACLVVWGGMALFGRPIGDYGVETDFYGDYAVKARKWISGEIPLSSFRGPVYPLVLALAGTVAADLFLAAKLLSVFSAAGGVRIAGGLLRRLWSPGVGVAGALFIAGNLSFAAYAFRACTDTFFWFLVAGTLWLLFARDRIRARDCVLAGLAAGITYLTRYNGAGLILGGLLAVILMSRSFSRALVSGALFAAPAALVISPWCFFLWKSTGDPFWNANFKNVAMAVFADNMSAASTGRLANAVGFTSLREVWSVDPGMFLATMGKHLGTHLWRAAQELVQPVWAGIAVLGFAANPRGWGERRRVAFVVIGFCLYLAVVPAFFNARFFLPLLIWWGVGVGLLADLLIRRARFRGRRWVVLGALALAGAMSNRAEILDSLNPVNSKAGPVDILELAEQVRSTGEAVGPRTPIAAQKPHIGYYLNAPIIRIPRDGSLADLREMGAHYLLVSGVEALQFGGLRPLQFVRDLSRVPSGLRVAARALSPLPGEGRYRAASLYAIENPLPWEPPEPRPTMPDRTTRPGFDRADHLRLELARWRYQWEPSLSLDPILENLSPEVREHPEVLLLRGDAALSRRDLERAEEFYTKATAAKPGDETALLRTGAISYLKDDLSGLSRTLESWRAQSPDPPNWFAVGVRLQQDEEYIAAIAPLGAHVTRNPEDSDGVQRLGLSLRQAGWRDRARALYQGFLVRHPEDLTVQNALQSLEGIEGSVTRGSAR